MMKMAHGRQKLIQTIHLARATDGLTGMNKNLVNGFLHVHISV